MNMLRHVCFLAAMALFTGLFSQSYTSFLTGNAADALVTAEYGVCLMGGATEQDDAMRWLLQRANGGDVVVLRATGGNGYNDYLYADLGVAVHSVETLVLPNRAAANHPYVRARVRAAEAIWIAGGDQHTYVSEWGGTAVDSALNDHIHVKKAVIGGTSAGMAVLCGRYFQAANGSITSEEALANPFHPNMTLGNQNFLQVPFLENTTTDTHYDARNRKGRHVAFLARVATDFGIRSYGIACDEYTAVCIDSAGKARVFGDFPSYDDNAYFLQANCDTPFVPEACVAGLPLTWNRDAQAVKVYAVKGTRTGNRFFELSDWKTGSGGVWEHWYAENGALTIAPGTAPDCDAVAGLESALLHGIRLFPNPANSEVFVRGLPDTPSLITVYDLSGKLCLSFRTDWVTESGLDVSGLQPGAYLVRVFADGKTGWLRFVRQ